MLWMGNFLNNRVCELQKSPAVMAALPEDFVVAAADGFFYAEADVDVVLDFVQGVFYGVVTVVELRVFFGRRACGLVVHVVTVCQV